MCPMERDAWSVCETSLSVSHWAFCHSHTVLADVWLVWDQSSLRYFLFQPVLLNWCNKNCGMSYLAYGGYKRSLAATRKE